MLFNAVSLQHDTRKMFDFSLVWAFHFCQTPQPYYELIYHMQAQLAISFDMVLRWYIARFMEKPRTITWLLQYNEASKNSDLVQNLQDGEALGELFIAIDRIKYKRFCPCYVADMQNLRIHLEILSPINCPFHLVCRTYRYRLQFLKWADY